MRTIEIDMQPSMILNLEEEAKAEGMTTQLLIIHILNDYFHRKASNHNSINDRLKQLRGSLASVKSMDLSNDTRAQQIINK